MFSWFESFRLVGAVGVKDVVLEVFAEVRVGEEQEREFGVVVDVSVLNVLDDLRVHLGFLPLPLLQFYHMITP